MHPLEAWGWSAEFQDRFPSSAGGSLEPARVVEEQRTIFRVQAAAGELEAAVAGRLRHARAERPAVGDWVAVEARAAEGRATLHATLPRRSALVRKVAGRTAEPQVIASNVDVVLVVTSCTREFNPRRLERFLAMAWEGGAEPVIVLNKSDLAEDPGAFVREASLLAPALAVSATSGAGFDALLARLPPRRTAALVGASGVGKSTLLNRLLGEARAATGPVREQDGRGRHTTTARRLHRLPCGALLVDTPGMRELGLLEAADGVADAFPEVDALAARCRFRDCRHETEPGCAVLQAARDGTLDAARLANYRKLQREAAYQARKEDPLAMRAEMRRWKAISKAARRLERER